MYNLEKIIENIEKRKNNTQKGIDKVSEIYESLRELDLNYLGIDKIFTKSFHINTTIHNGMNYVKIKGYFKFRITNEEGLCLSPYSMNDIFRELWYIKGLDYVNFKEFAEALRELFKFLENLETEVEGIESLPTF